MKILSTADNHIGFRQYGLLRRERDIEQGFRSVLELGVELGVSAITVSGDILHSVRPTAHTIQFLKQCQKYLKEHNMLCLVSIGNHDNSNPHWISNISDDASVGFRVLNDESFVINGVSIYGKTFCSRSEFDQGACVPKTTDILLMHQSFNELTTFPSEKSFTYDDFTNVDAKIVIIGDTHIHQSFDLDGMTICSPGSTELISEPEEDIKRVYVHTLTGETWETESHSIKTRKIVKMLVDSEGDISEGIKYLQNIIDEEPMVFIRFNTELGDALSRFRKQIDSNKVIIRPRPVMNKTDASSGEYADEEDLTFSDILKTLIPDSPAQFETVSQLLNPDADVNSIIDKFVADRLGVLEDE